jgi:O-antigen/teichoic acid export membrane protein
MMGSSYQAIGWYAAGVRIVDAVGMVPTMVAAALLPVLSSLHQRDPEAMRGLYLKGQRLLLILGLPAAAGLFSVRTQIAVFVYGAEFTQTAGALIWLAPAVAILFLNFMQLNTLTALGQQRLCAIATGVCVVVNIGLNLLLIPIYGFTGAAMATLATEISLFVQCARYIHSQMGASKVWSQGIKPAIAALAMALVLAWVQNLPLPMVVGLGIVVYFGVLSLLGGITRAECGELLKLLKRQPGA